MFAKVIDIVDLNTCVCVCVCVCVLSFSLYIYVPYMALTCVRAHFLVLFSTDDDEDELRYGK